MNQFTHHVKSVDVLTENGWMTFESVKDAAAFIGCSQGTLSSKLIHDLPCAGYKVRYHKNNEL